MMDDRICGREGCTNPFAIHRTTSSAKNYCFQCAQKINKIAEARICLRDPNAQKVFASADKRRVVTVKLEHQCLSSRVPEGYLGVTLSVNLNAVNPNSPPPATMRLEELLEIKEVIDNALEWIDQHTSVEEGENQYHRPVTYRKLKYQGE